jgi:hypothetical protein
VLVIHTDSEGEITKADLDKAREAARDIDKSDNKIKAIVSVMMLREGWDVRNVSVVLGLRPFTADAVSCGRDSESHHYSCPSCSFLSFGHGLLPVEK